MNLRYFWGQFKEKKNRINNKKIGKNVEKEEIVEKYRGNGKIRIF